MEKIIGIFDEQAVYAERFKRYINERKDIGCFAVTFQKEEELLDYCARKKLSCLVAGEEAAKQLKDQSLPCGVRMWILTGREPAAVEAEGRHFLFRYQKAGEIIRQILLVEMAREEYMSELFTVLSVESCRLAAEYADRLLQELAEKGKTLFLPWDPFYGYGRTDSGDGAGASLSELLYLVRKDREQARRLFDGLPKRNGAEYFCGPEYCTDLWQYSAEEMRQLVLCCREYGGYKHVVFLCGAFHEGAVSIMNQSCQVCLVTSETPEGKQRKQEFYRQMKYAGEQGVLSRVVEITVSTEQGV
ncbi:MAG: hypothetical protein J6J42_13545 [Lachnospiraceae bacterium]|nr:hypothetical protein [Lachnospiraceae bacterium]